MAEHQLTCRTCGAQFLHHRRKAYCSTRCRPSVIAKREAKRGDKPQRWADGIPECHKEHTCLNCGVAFKPKRAGRTKFCGRGCGLEWTGLQITLRRTGGRVSVSVLRKRCAACGRRHSNAGTYCGDECRPPAYARRIYANCRNCGKAFDRRDDGATRYMCSQSCASESDARARRAERKARRARERGARRTEIIDPLKVFERDGWRCGICGRKTHKAKRGSHHPRAPELDHIVALANGGTHTWRNVQCSCRECNGRKGATNYGQIPLFPAA